MANVIFQHKKSLEDLQPIVIKNCKEDFGLSMDVNIAFNADPPRSVIMGLIEVIAANETLDEKRKEAMATGDAKWSEYEEINKEEIDRRNTLYYSAVSNLIIDIDVDGVNFDTPDKAEEALDSDLFPFGFLYSAVSQYIGTLILEHDRLKKIMTQASET